MASRYAIVVGEALGARYGLAILDTLPAEITPRCQPFWVGRVVLLARLLRIDEVRNAYRRAIGLSEDPLSVII